MNKTQDKEAALLREELAKLLSTLKHNREKVPLDVLKTKYKKGPVRWILSAGSQLPMQL